MKNKIIKILLVICIFFTTVTSVNAKVLTADEIIKEIENTESYKALLELEMPITGKIEDTDKLTLYNESEKLISFNIGEDYLEYDNRDYQPPTTDEEINIFQWMLKYLSIGVLFESVFRLSGYEGYTISDDYVDKMDYEKYGLIMETVTNEDDDGSTSTEMTYLKISTDTEKIVKLMTEYGEKMEEETSELIASLVPDIEAKNITQNSATIYMDIPNYSYEDIDENILCYVYRADTKDGLYKEISKGLNCMDSVGMVDKDLDKGKTYYYKAKVYGANDYSKVIEVNTKISSSTVVEENDKIEENPKTGKIYSFAILFIILLLNAVTIVRIRKTYF